MLLAAFAGSASQLIRSGESNGGEAVLILWAPAVLLFFIFVGEMITARYILLALPPLFLIAFRQTPRARLAFTLAATALLSITLAHADSRFVSSYREWARRVIPDLQADGFLVHSAAESGLRFYLEEMGVETLSRTNLRPAGGDLIVRSDLFRYGLAEDVEVVLLPLKRFTLDDRFPVRTFNPGARAGFYDSRAGLAPFVLSRAPHDTIEVAQLNPLVQRLPQHSTNPEEAPVWSPNGPIYRQTGPVRIFPMRLPLNMEIQYELDEGTGVIERTSEGIRLVKTSGASVVWRRLRFMPVKFMEAPD
jgi:hypothetical protein